MKIKKNHIVKYIKLLTDTSSFRLVKEYHIQGDRPLRAIPTYFDALWCKLRYGLTTKEYFFFDFYNKSSYARRQFISSAESYWTISTKINSGDKSLFSNKHNTFEAYKEFFRREAVLVNLPSDANSVFNFAAKHGGFILKPLNLSQGTGIQLWNKDMPDASERLQRLVMDSKLGEAIMEELINQDEGMAAFHPSSVNTIRYVVYYNDKGVDRLFAFIRIGVGDSNVDNTSAGGICAGIDLETGLIVTEGLRRNGERFLFHPDSGKQIIGTQIPKWKELNELIEKLRPKDSPVRFVGWDMALSKDGWCIVEGNWGPSIIGIQGCLGKGYRSTIMKIKQDRKL